MSVSVYTTNQMSMNNTNTSTSISKDLKKKFTKTFDLSQIAEDPMDSYLDTLGLWKKRIARDGSCLFRAVAEQIYPCQMYHEKVRQECIRYMSDHRDEFSKYVSTISFDEYLEAMKNPLENGGQLEIAAMSKLYQRDFIIFQHQNQPGVDVTQNGYDRKIYLCYSYNNHFDAIFSKSHRDRLALIQSLVYELLYDRVFGSGEQVSVARKLLRKSDTIYPKEYMNIREEFDEYDSDEDEEEPIELLDDEESEMENLDNNEDEENKNEQIENDLENKKDDLDVVDENSETITSDQNNNDLKLKDNNNNNNKKSKIKIKASDSQTDDKLSIIQKMPLPYKVAKSLDPYIYRNTAFDAWLATKKEIEQAANLNAISVLQPGDKCMVKLMINYNEKWSLAFLQNILHDSANVFVPELNETHCVPLENLKVYNNANELLLIHYTGNLGQQQQSQQQHQSIAYTNPNGVQNVQKFVQSINAHFSKIFINAENKRRTTKKKQFAMKKSSSFHAFSNELPTLLEVEEQNDDLFLYSSHPYYPHHHPHHHVYHPNSSNLQSTQGFYSIPHSQTHPNFTDHLTQPNKSVNNANKTSQSANQANNLSNSSQNKIQNRRPRFSQNNQNNLSSGQNKNIWPNNPPYLAPLSQQLAPPQPPHLQMSAGLNMPPPPLPSLVGPPGQAFMPPPPPMPQLHPHPPGSLQGPPPPPFMHHPTTQQTSLGPHPHAPPNMPQIAHQPRPNFFNPISSPFMFGPPPPQPVPAPLAHLNHPHMPGMIDHHNGQFYFANASGSGNKNQTNLMPERKQRHDSVDSYLNKTTSTTNGTTTSYQQVPQHLTNQGLLTQANNQTNPNDSSLNQNSTLTNGHNPNNYLLMPAPPANTTPNQQLITTTPGSYASSSSLTRSHSYHSGISSYESHNQLVNTTNSNNVYVDVYMQPPPLPQTQQQTNQQQSHLNQNQAAIIGANNQNTIMHQTNMTSSNSTLTGALANSANNQQLYNTSLDQNGSSYGANFTGYEMQYSRFDNSLTSNGVIDDNLLNSSENRTSNLWNKTNKLTKSTSLFSDMMYAGETSQPNLMPISNNTNSNQQFCYTNCFVVNIDGPINFNATHSLQDDGSDLPFNDINTIRFFYNLGIEYYRLNIAPPYNQGPSYSTLYQPNTTNTLNTNMTSNSTGVNLTNSNSTNTLNQTDQQIIDSNPQLTNQQVVPNTKQQQQQQQGQQSLIQQNYNQTRRVH